MIWITTGYLESRNVVVIMPFLYDFLTEFICRHADVASLAGTNPLFFYPPKLLVCPLLRIQEVCSPQVKYRPALAELGSSRGSCQGLSWVVQGAPQGRRGGGYRLKNSAARNTRKERQPSRMELSSFHEAPSPAVLRRFRTMEVTIAFQKKLLMGGGASAASSDLDSTKKHLFGPVSVD